MSSKNLETYAGPLQCTDVHFASFLSRGITTVVVLNPPERKLAKGTSRQWWPYQQHANAATFYSAKSRPGLGLGGLTSCGGPAVVFAMAVCLVWTFIQIPLNILCFCHQNRAYMNKPYLQSPFQAVETF